MDALMAGIVVLLAAVFMIRHVRRAASGGGSCGCGGSGERPAHADPRRVSVPGLSCSGGCAQCRRGKTQK